MIPKLPLGLGGFEGGSVQTFQKRYIRSEEYKE